MGEGRILHVDCDTHGWLWDEAAWCHHDVETATRNVLDAHRAPYGANCHAQITVTLLDPDTLQPAAPPTRHGWEPPVDPANGRSDG